MTRQRKLAEMMGFSEFCLSEGSRRSQEKPGPRLGRYLQAASLCMLWGEPVAPTVRPPRPRLMIACRAAQACAPAGSHPDTRRGSWPGTPSGRSLLTFVLFVDRP
ncbi:hypothetical protein L504_5244 [Bordetella bronchiseptica F2]|nr:hypothetical protein L489_5462 [Bordetella bronchiseptica 00-P-2730]KDC22023.1 hypothetical protein L542_5124 [Bordetella bronchiseptica F-1]KDC28462.1 hypothetical protein L504_5244 [Bordetella bronchiseptica F2]KDD10890.1 hypothetical protein L522_0067 [Bordetella bronchiseptica MBORD707]KDD97645.1 hypothetical protein L531_4805 [Bordetella bronchiseptica MO275]